MRMGTSHKIDPCKTCFEKLQECNGHFGHVKLILPVFHVGYFKKIISILQCICKDCSRLLLSELDRRKFANILRRPDTDSLKRYNIIKKVNDQCRKNKTCFHCGAVNGLVRKVGTNALKISHDKFKAFNMSTSKNKVPPPSKEHFDQSFESAKQNNPEVEKHFKKALDDLNPLRVLKLFKRIPDADCELLGLADTRPEVFLWRQVPAPPICIRPSVGQEGASTEDDLTAKLGDIVSANANLMEALNKGAPVQSIIEHWDYLSLQIAMYINSDVPGLQKGEYGKQIRGFVQRLKGKQGRFRGNLSGKRVDFSGRTVISKPQHRSSRSSSTRSQEYDIS
jgi:DNA-directed RNA polymerase III subunit RPC1